VGQSRTAAHLQKKLGEEKPIVCSLKKSQLKRKKTPPKSTCSERRQGGKLARGLTRERSGNRTPGRKTKGGTKKKSQGPPRSGGKLKRKENLKTGSCHGLKMWCNKRFGGGRRGGLCVGKQHWEGLNLGKVPRGDGLQ